MSEFPHILDELLGAQTILVDGAAVKRRAKLNLHGVGAVDDPDNAWTDITFSGSGTALGRFYDAIRSVIDATAAGSVLHGKGFAALSDGGGGQWVIDDTGTFTDDGGTILCPGGYGTSHSKAAVRVYDGPLNIKWFGFSESNTAADNAFAWNLCMLAGDNIYIPPGRYSVVSLQALAAKHIHGAGSGKTFLIQEAGDTGAVLWLGDTSQNVPSPIYAALRHHVHDLALCMATTGKWGLRAREIAYCAFHDLYIGYDPDTSDTCTGTALYVDGSINCRFENVQCRPAANAPNVASIGAQFRPSAELDGVAGSGSGAGCTSTKVIACYFHHANYGLYGSSLNNVTFDHCVFETNLSHGVVCADALKAKFLDCYYENNAGYAVFANGVDTRLHGLVEVSGGFAQRNNDAGFINTGGGAGKPFLGAQFCDRVKVHGVQIIAGNVPIIQTVEAIGGNQQIEMEAQPYSFHTARENGRTTTLANAIDTTSGSPNLTIHWTNHGLVIGNVLDIKGATSPLHLLAPNRPHWLVIGVPNANTITVEPLLFAGTYTANATDTSLGGASITLNWYGNGDWANLMIPNTDVLLTDCEYETVRCSVTVDDITTISNGADLTFDGAPTLVFDRYTYIMSAQLITSEAITSPRPSVRYYQLNLQGAGFDDYALKLFDHSGAGDVGLNALPKESILYRAFPGQELKARIFMSGDQDEVFPRTETIEFVLAKTKYSITSEV